MNELIIISTSLALGVLILFFEFSRTPARGAIDALRLTSAVYFVAFAVVPIYLQLGDLKRFRDGPWSWIVRSSFDGDAYVLAALACVAGYLCIVGGYLAVPVVRRSWGRCRKSHHPPSTAADALIAGLVALLVGLVALTIYTQSIGGIGVLVTQAAAFRGPTPPVVTPLAFLKNIAPLVMGGAILLYGVILSQRRPPRYVVALFVLSLLASLLILFHQAGRLTLFAFLMTFPLARVILGRPLSRRVVALGGVLFAILVLFGKQLFMIASSPAVFRLRWDELSGDVFNLIHAFLLEFSFPLVSLANAIVDVPTASPYRWFVDVPLSVMYLLPERLIEFELTPTVSMVNTNLLGMIGGGVPVDLLSFGYFSAGIFGLVIVSAVFGALLSIFDGLLNRAVQPQTAALWTAWLLFLSFRVMYAGPWLVLEAGFFLITTTLLLLLPVFLRSIAPTTGLRRREVLFPTDSTRV